MEEHCADQFLLVNWMQILHECHLHSIPKSRQLCCRTFRTFTDYRDQITTVLFLVNCFSENFFPHLICAFVEHLLNELFDFSASLFVQIFPSLRLIYMHTTSTALTLLHSLHLVFFIKFTQSPTFKMLCICMSSTFSSSIERRVCVCASCELALHSGSLYLRLLCSYSNLFFPLF